MRGVRVYLVVSTRSGSMSKRKTNLNYIENTKDSKPAPEAMAPHLQRDLYASGETGKKKRLVTGGIKDKRPPINLQPVIWG